MWATSIGMLRAMSTQDPIKSKRVPRFVEEYAKDRNGTQAAIRAGYSPVSAHSTASALLSDPKVQALVAEEQERVSKTAHFEAVDVLREWVAIATADPSKIVKVRRVNCRYCHGIGHQYQWGARQYAEACDAALRPVKKGDPEPSMPDCAGGFGWLANAEPHPGCPECCGEGVEDIFFNDTESLTGPERKLIAGVKRTKDGLEVKLRDQDAAVQHLAKYLGLLIERKELTGKDGKPLLGPAVPDDLPTDPAALGALYTHIMGGG